MVPLGLKLVLILKQNCLLTYNWWGPTFGTKLILRIKGMQSWYNATSPSKFMRGPREVLEEGHRPIIK